MHLIKSAAGSGIQTKLMQLIFVEVDTNVKSFNHEQIR